MTRRSRYSARTAACLAACTLALAGGASADNLLRNGKRANVASDLKSLEIGDILTVVVVQRAEARNSSDSVARRDRSATGQLSTDVLNQTGDLSLNGDFNGHGEIRRSESFVTQISVTIQGVAPNGDLTVAGEQRMKVNGEQTVIRVRGRVRPQDVSTDNQFVSSRLADAEIDYDGKGFVSRNAGSGPLGWLFNAFGLAG
ncbi:MAG TPA: flagellar basal body L-ring protein FlgH [Hyphomonadaceae bacterium]|jgi:flagellar L-ring protein precursor FlgH|nr:flagellar basal body L-ring protein FlgH [Hyphomonadaceae bacterium]